MANDIGTPVIATLVPKSTLDKFPIIRTNQALGGHHQYETTAERDAIPTERRYLGMLCTVGLVTYRLETVLDNSGWKDVLLTVNNQISSINGSISDLEETVEGITVGYTYTVANKADLPATVNGAAVAIFAEVYKDNVSDDNNGRYYQDPGVSTWLKVPGDLTARVVNLEGKTAIYDLSKEVLYFQGVRLRYVCMSPNADVYWAVDINGKFISLHDHDIATTTVAGFMSGADKVLLSSLDADNAGIHVELAAIQAQLDALAIQNVPLEYVEGHAARFAMRTEDGSVFLHNRTSDGVIRIKESEIDSIRIGHSGYALKVRTDIPGWYFCLLWENDDLAFGIESPSGNTVIPGFVPSGGGGGLPGPGTITTEMLIDESVTHDKLSDESVTHDKLSDEVNIELANTYQPSMPDDARLQDSLVGLWSAQSWQTLPREVTPIIEGINTPSTGSGTSLDFRRTAGLLIAGQRRVGTYDPSYPGNSILYRGIITASSTFPPAGTYADGDYLSYVESTPRVIGIYTVYLGDSMVRVAGAWLHKPNPSGSIEPLRKDYWEISVNGIYEGITLAVGDRLVYTTLQAAGSYAYYRWRKGMPTNKECFRRGEFDPAAGLAASPLDRDLWEASVAGTTGGFTFAIGDYALRMGSVWALIKNDTIRTYANGAAIHLPCFQSSAEWEFRRTDKSITKFGLTLSTRSALTQYRSDPNPMLYADSMGGGVIAPLATALGRTVTGYSYGGGKADEIEGMMEYHALTNDVNKGKMLVTIVGQNNNTSLGHNLFIRSRMEQMMSSHDNRFVHFSMLGERKFTWDGTRLVCANFEQQIVAGSTNPYAKDVAALKLWRPNNWLSAAETLGKASIGDTAPSVQWPGKTNEQVWLEYRIPALKYCRSITPSNGLDYCINYISIWTSGTLPTGGVSGDYYLRTVAGGGGVIGNPIANILGVWTEITFDSIHLNSLGDTVQANGIAAFILAKGW